MKHYELLDMIGEVNEDYVLAADDADHVVRPRFRWKALAACAACAALIAAAYPAYRAFPPQDPASDSALNPEEVPETVQGAGDVLVQRPGQHAYFLVEDDGVQIITTAGDDKTPFAAYNAPPAGANTSSDSVEPVVPSYNEQGEDVPVQEEADRQHSALLQWLFGTNWVSSDETYPEWFGGVWIDNDAAPEARLAIAIVDSFHTPGLEAQIRERCGGTREILFPSVKYAWNDLMGLMDQIGQVFEELDCRAFLTYGPDVIGNRVALDFFEEPSGEVLAALDVLDPDGDAIFIQVFPGTHIALTSESAKGPAPEPMTEPVPGGVTEPAAETGAAAFASETAMPAHTENGRPVSPEEAGRMKEVDQGAVNELPQAKYDVIQGEQ